MSIAKSMLAEFEQEWPITRKFLERVPEDKLTWKPHEKSMSAGELALHIAMVPSGVLQLVKQDRANVPDFGQPNPQPQSVREILDVLEQSVATVRVSLPEIDDAAMNRNWVGVLNGKEVITAPRAGFLRNVLLNHWYQHRGQLGVYLRLMDVKVPSSYGPSADELPDFLQQTQSASN